MLQDIDKAILRAWSAVVSRGMLGSPQEVAAQMGNGVALAEVRQRMADLRAISQLPRETLLPPVAS
jgi:hypothetical protein